MIAIKRPLILREYIAQTGLIPDGLQLIRNTFDFKPLDIRRGFARNPLSEDKNTAPKFPVMRCTGVFQRADEKNANGRIYPLDILKEAIAKLEKPVKARKVLGEFDHPPDAKIHLDRISHLITKLWMENKTVMGEIEVINDDRSPCGSQLACLLDRNIQVGISSRGVGDMELVEDNGEDAYVVMEGFEFITFDSVAEPSVSGTQLNKIHEQKILSLKRKVTNDKLVGIREAKEKLVAIEMKKLLLS